MQWSTPLRALVLAALLVTATSCAPPDPPPPLRRAAGEACATAAQCESGICEGHGCDGESGRCSSGPGGCNRDLKAYCGCDGTTFYASGNCPGKRYAHREPCP